MPRKSKTHPHTSEAWDAFEAHIANLYQALGYRVRRNDSVYGQQVDIVAERYIPGIGTTRTLIECKHSSRNKKVGNQTVYDFSHYLHTIQQTEHILRGVIVSNTGFTKDAMNAAKSTPLLSLLTPKDLADGLLNVSDYIIQNIQSYENKEIYWSYIHLHGHGRTPNETRDTQISDIDRAIHSWLSKNNPGFLTILGDFGEGKTTLMERLNYTYSKNSLETKASYAPLLLPLKELIYYDTIWNYVLDTIKQTTGIAITPTALKGLMDRGQVLFLLDGFDEISTNVTELERYQHFHFLRPIIASDSPAIMTCRPTYFVSAVEYNQLLESLHSNEPLLGHTVVRPSSEDSDEAMRLKQKLYSKYVYVRGENPLAPEWYSTISIEPLDTDQIDWYLSQYEPVFKTHLGVSALQVRQFLFNVYDLKDLMRRPMLLAMIKDTGGLSLWLRDHEIWGDS